MFLPFKSAPQDSCLPEEKQHLVFDYNFVTYQLLNSFISLKDDDVIDESDGEMEVGEFELLPKCFQQVVNSFTFFSPILFRIPIWPQINSMQIEGTLLQQLLTHISHLIHNH